jgi:hypothetical protein
VRGVKVLRVGWLYVSAPRGCPGGVALPAIIGRCASLTYGTNAKGDEVPGARLVELRYESGKLAPAGLCRATFLNAALEHVH